MLRLLHAMALSRDEAHTKDDVASAGPAERRIGCRRRIASGLGMQTVKYRLINPGLRPRRTRLEIPGWAGKAEPRVDGSHEYAWHCLPFSEAAKAGIELFYPYDKELHVSMRNSELMFEGEFGPLDDPDAERPPFRSFGRE